ncbi:MAG: hypothetical protein CML59_06615 [Rhodobacteraceae bacterium]|nr:hypothetical protein [Paracoccaceae bacterium]
MNFRWSIETNAPLLLRLLRGFSICCKPSFYLGLPLNGDSGLRDLVHPQTSFIGVNFSRLCA